ncbi:DUF3604 domain-containing protein [Tropicimonas aquimaris]|uniref:DUF3604 domain-containing protein n=1 Tax=Tropicimonas aquimaris TaxID=914152 RepID=A0ABW3IPZ7_9RHOB
MTQRRSSPFFLSELPAWAPSELVGGAQAWGSVATLRADIAISRIERCLPADPVDEEELWARMAEQKAKGSPLLAIPHSSNGRKDPMFEPVNNAGNPLARDDAETRAGGLRHLGTANPTSFLRWREPGNT